MMENKENKFLFGVDLDTDRKQEPQQNDIDNLQKVVLQSFKYCQAKKSKNRYIRTKKIEEMKNYQKKLITIVKKKSEEIISDLTNFSNLLISAEESDEKDAAKRDQQTLSALKQKISALKKSSLFHERRKNAGQSEQLHQKIKRVTLQCEEQLQKMQSEEKDKKTDEQIQKLINQMQKPFKKLCSYFAMLTKEIKEGQDQTQKKANEMNN